MTNPNPALTPSAVADQAKQLGLAVVALTAGDLASLPTDVLPLREIEQRRILPYRFDETTQTLFVAVADVTQLKQAAPVALQRQRSLGRRLNLQLVEPATFDALLSTVRAHFASPPAAQHPPLPAPAHPPVDLSPVAIPRRAFLKIPRDVAEKFRLVVFEAPEGAASVKLASDQPDDPDVQRVVEVIRAKRGVTVELYTAAKREVEALLRAYATTQDPVTVTPPPIPKRVPVVSEVRGQRSEVRSSAQDAGGGLPAVDQPKRGLSSSDESSAGQSKPVAAPPPAALPPLPPLPKQEVGVRSKEVGTKTTAKQSQPEAAPSVMPTAPQPVGGAPAARADRSDTRVPHPEPAAPRAPSTPAATSRVPRSNPLPASGKPLTPTSKPLTPDSSGMPIDDSPTVRPLPPIEAGAKIKLAAPLPPLTPGSAFPLPSISPAGGPIGSPVPPTPVVPAAPAITSQPTLTPAASAVPQPTPAPPPLAAQTPHGAAEVTSAELTNRSAVTPLAPIEATEEQALDTILGTTIKSPDELESVVKTGLVPKVLAAILQYAVSTASSDVHIEAAEESLRVRYRIDGMLRDVLKAPLGLHAPLVSRIKILSRMKIDEQRIPQDGRFTATTQTHDVDFRVSSLPAIHGEKIVLRLLDKSVGLKPINELGIDGVNGERINAALRKPYGIILVTGPTGSGKTTTLYSMLTTLNQPGVNIVTLEDPVEYELAGITQTQVKPKIGFSFAEGLRSILRQDPDVIMVGEIRDRETASLSTHAALTGHLVLSTLHTNTAAGAIPRFINMGVEPFLIASSIEAVIAQRLARRLCDSCRQPATLSDAVRKDVVDTLTQSVVPAVKQAATGQLQFFGPKGCAECHDGYKGRMGLYEVMTVTPEIESLTAKKSTLGEINTQAVQQGMVTMKQDGLLKALKGQTSLDEVFRVTTSD